MPGEKIDEVLPEARKSHFEQSLSAIALNGTVVINERRMEELIKYAQENGRQEELNRAIEEADNVT